MQILVKLKNCENESNDSDEQKWEIKQTEDGFYNIIS